VQAVYRVAVELSANLLEGAPLNPPLLLMLDEAGNIAPLKALPKIASTGAGQGITLMTIWQDRAQIRQLYNDAERTVIANHTTSVWLPGSQDLDTLKLLADLIGDQWVTSNTVSAAADGGVSVSQGAERIDVAPPAFLRTLTHGQAVMLSGNLPPALIATHAYYEQPRWQHLIDPAQLARHAAMHQHAGPTTADTAKERGLDVTFPGPAIRLSSVGDRTGQLGTALNATYPDIEADRAAHHEWGQTAAGVPTRLSTAPRTWADTKPPTSLLRAAGILPSQIDLRVAEVRRRLLTAWLQHESADSIAAGLTFPQLAVEWDHLHLDHALRQCWEDCYPALAGSEDIDTDLDQAVAS
jgi:hypothetical protein